MKSISVDVSLHDETVTANIDPETFIQRIPRFLLNAEIKRRDALVNTPHNDPNLDFTEKATRADFPVGSTLPVETDVDISTNATVDAPECDCEDEAAMTIDDIDAIAEAFRRSNMADFELFMTRSLPDHLADRLSTRLRQ